MTHLIDRRSLMAAGFAATAVAPAAGATAIDRSATALTDYRARFVAAFGEFERFVRPHSESFWLSHNRATALAFAHERASVAATS